MTGYTVLGQRLAKVDGLERVTGKAAYGADVHLPGMLHGKVLRSPHPHARIRRIDFSKALSLPGVIAVVTAGDMRAASPAAEGHQQGAAAGAYDPGHEEEAVTDRPNSATTVFAGAKALWVGQAVAAVAAVSLEIAEAALELIQVEYEVLPAVLDAEEGMKPTAPLLHANLFTQTLGAKPTHPSNIATSIGLGRGDVAEGFRQADVIIEDTYRTRMVHQGYLEPRATMALVEPNGKITVWSSSQGSFRIQEQLSEIFNVPLNLVNVIPMEMGGGFGSKTQGVLEPVAVLLARKTGRPVKLVMNRAEEFQAGRPGAPSVIYLKMGATRDGQLTATEMKVIMDGGAFPGGPVAAATSVGLGTYRVPNLHVEGYDVVTNKPPVGAYRAPGAPQAAFAVESHMDRLADAIGMDPLEFRLKNVAAEGDRLPTDVALPRVGFRETLEAVRDHPVWNHTLLGPNQGRGIACGMWIGGIQPNSATLKVNSDGTLALMVGTVDVTGTRTALVQMVAEEFGLPPSEISVSVLPTESAPYASVSAGSKTTYTMSVAVKRACDAVRAELLKRGAVKLDLPVDQVGYLPRQVQAKGDPRRSVSLQDLAKASVAAGEGPIIYTGIAGRVRQAPSFAANVVDVEVDRETGKVKLLNYVVFQECGFAINPTQVEGQMQGGATQGIGWALTEEYVFDRGVMRNATWLDYRMPTALDLPMLDTQIVQVPNPEGPYGVRGVGEVSIVPPMAAIANAIARATGVRLTELPMSPEKVFFAVKEAERA